MTSSGFDPFAGGEILRLSPTTWPQKEIIASAQMSDEASTAFNEAVSVTLRGEVDADLLERCFDVLMQRHDVLRSTFSRNGNELCLRDLQPFTMGFEDLRPLAASRQTDLIERYWRNIALSPMNLEEGPLVFAWLFQLEDQQFELVIAAHHVICDGWSFGLLLNELASIYRHGGLPTDLPEPGSFHDFAEHLDAQQIANSDIDHWQGKFADTPPALDLPLDRPRPASRPFAAARLDYDLGKELVGALPRAAAGMKASLVNVVLAGYFALLHRLTGAEDLVVGLPVAGQAAFDRVNQVGHLVQLLPIRIACTGRTTFRELVSLVKAEVLDSTEHPNFTFGKLIEGMTIDRSRVPLVCTIFNIDQPLDGLDFGTATATVRSVPRSAENFEIFLNIQPSAERLIIEATYSTVLFGEASIRSWLTGLERLLEQVVVDPERCLADYALASELPRELAESHASRMDLPFEDVAAAFSAHASRHPRQEAVVSGDSVLTYRDLDERSNAVASHLASHGVGAGDIVAVCCGRGTEMVAAILGILKMGAAYLPLDAEFPAERLAFMLQDSGAAALVQDENAPSAISSAIDVRFELRGLGDLDPVSELSMARDVGPDRLAYLIYTSGSTGQPKGVRVSMGSMANFLASMARCPGCGPADRLLAVTTLSFDISILELFLPLVCGGTVVIASSDEARDGVRLAAMMRERSITIMQATPATWRLLLASQWKDHPTSGLKALCGGEPLPPDLAKEIVPRVADLWNMYGPTETTVWSTCKRIDLEEELITIGGPIGNTQVYVLDDQFNPLPVSVPGELFIGGHGLAQGYHGLPDLTEEKFIDHPRFGRVYRTGDLAKLLPGGEIQHLGRRDDQIKVRGYRIELGEIESVLLECPGVEAAAAYLWEIDHQDVRLVACCVPHDPGGLETVAIRKTLRARLPGYMVPQYLLAIDHVPLTPGGKVDRRALPRPEITESNIFKGTAPATPTEKLVAEIWQDLVKTGTPVGRDDNFFELGGHSLLALQAIQRIENETGTRLAAGDLVTGRLAAICEKLDTSEQPKSAEDTGPVPLSSAVERQLSWEQVRILQRQLRFPGNLCNNLPASWLLGGVLDVEAFEKSLKRVLERQTALRTIIREGSGAHHQIIRHVDDMDVLEFGDCSAEEDPLSSALGQARVFCERPFSPVDAQLFRAKLFCLGADKHLFVFVPHQLVFDGWSFDIFLREVEKAYVGLLTEQPARSGPLPFEFRDFAHWSRSRPASQEDILHHRGSLRGQSPASFIRSDGEKGECRRQIVEFPVEVLGSVEAYCEAHHLRIHEFLLAAFVFSLVKQSGQPSGLLGMPVSGRTRPDVIGLVGCFVSTLPFSYSLEARDLPGVAAEVAASLKEFLDRQDVSYAEVVRGTDQEADWYPSRLTASVGFQDVRNRPTSLHGLSLAQIDMPRKHTELPIEFWTRVHSEGLMAAFDYDTSLVAEDVVNDLCTGFAEAIHGTGDPERLPSLEIPVDEAEQGPTVPLWKRLFG